MIAVDRSKGSQALPEMNACVRRELARNRQVIIFPEGTRRPPGAEPRYKQGVAHLYVEAGVACLPIALNSGLFWPRRSMQRRPGTIRVEVLDPIPPGLDKTVFFERLQTAIENATARLLKEGEQDLAAAGISPGQPGTIIHPHMRHRASMRMGSARLSLRPEPLRQPVQLRIPVAQLLQCRDGCNDIVAVRSRHTMSLADVVQFGRPAKAAPHIADGRGPRCSIVPAPYARPDLPATRAEPLPDILMSPARVCANTSG